MTTMTAEASLTTAHLAQLRDGSGISPEVIQERGYRSITQLTALLDFGFSAAQSLSTAKITEKAKEMARDDEVS